ncbi:hypothetical protein FGO68_gene10567 [Halteria grandinella]|uniref:Uncharacterized protein n=1 Tax=Halteria grandinella TaxID=5974 RepID=A0A8J8T419_HALGN|nr:hypothetical protein FGO68_gene10567 [Halteria grandinella]
MYSQAPSAAYNPFYDGQIEKQPKTLARQTPNTLSARQFSNSSEISPARKIALGLKNQLKKQRIEQKALDFQRRMSQSVTGYTETESTSRKAYRDYQYTEQQREHLSLKQYLLHRLKQEDACADSRAFKEDQKMKPKGGMNLSLTDSKRFSYDSSSSSLLFKNYTKR